jgi:hypothetical protein
LPSFATSSCVASLSIAVIVRRVAAISKTLICLKSAELSTSRTPARLKQQVRFRSAPRSAVRHGGSAPDRRPTQWPTSDICKWQSE